MKAHRRKCKEADEFIADLLEFVKRLSRELRD
jgi:hypothetical protein